MICLEKHAFFFPHIMVKALNDGVYLRGCISIGDFYYSKKMIVGAAGFEAAAHYELPQWIGISAAPSAYAVTTNSEKIDDGLMKSFVKWNIPLKKGIEKYS